MTFEFRRTILDGLHGQIDLTQEEMDIIDHPLFQRLRRMPQTGLLYLIAPSAVHTRFEHSIGVMHMADKVLRSIVKESRKDERHMFDLTDVKPGQAVRFFKLPRPFFSRLRRVTRICALSHDLGHGPLSHTFDAFAPSVGDIERLLSEPALASISHYTTALLQSKTGRVEHETMSCLLFAKLWSDLGGEQWMPSLVSSVLLGVAPVGVPAELIPWIPFIRDIVASSPVDADRMDYLLRDSRAMGVTYGLYESGRLLKSALCVRSLTHNEYRLGWRHSGLSAVVNFVMCRYQMFREFYSHKTYRGAELALQAIASEAIRSGISVIDTTSLDSLVASYEFIGDDIFMRMLEGKIHPGFPDNGLIETLSAQLRQRRLWKRIYDFAEDSQEIRIVLPQQMQKAFPNALFVVDNRPLRATKGLENGSYLVRLHADRRYSYTPRDAAKGSWLQSSIILRALREEELAHTRLYLCVQEESKKDCYNIRSHAFKLAHALHLAEDSDEETVLR